MRLTICLLLFIGLLALDATELPAQHAPRDPWCQRPADAASIHRSMQKLGVLGTVMYVAAHPDDENTRLIAWFSRQRLVRTVYLSLTRGDGGQNLIGPEMSELLGVLRTQELLGARRLDGGEQWFTRANDFGYSKTAEETMTLWNKEAVLADVVWAIRKFRPDVIVNRFNAENSGSTHGHHTASAQLALEAFEMAGDPNAFPEQLQWVKPWQPRRLFFNTSWWFYGSQEAFDQADKSRMSQVDIGVYEPWSGFSNSEVAMLSRSMHRCQGFGAELYRGENPDYLDLLKGDLPGAPDDPLSGIDLSWNRVPGGDAIQEAIQRLSADYDFRQPAQSLTALLQLYRQMQSMPDHPWKARKLEELNRVIADCAGIFAEAKTSQNSSVPGQDVTFSLELTQRAGSPFRLDRIHTEGIEWDTLVNTDLRTGQPWKVTHRATLAKDLPWTAPYWLTREADGGLYHVPDQTLRGMPESPAAVRFVFRLVHGKDTIHIQAPLVHKQTDPAYGERYQPFHLLPPGFVTPLQPVGMVPFGATREIAVKVRAGQDSLEGEVHMHLPPGWKAEPRQQYVFIRLQGDEQELRFTVTPPANASIAEATFSLETGGRTYPYSLQSVRYDHIPLQQVLQPARMRLVHTELEGTDARVGYLPGAGDQVAECLRDAGYAVTMLEESDLTPEHMARYDAIVTGVRAYNTRDGLRYRQDAIQEYIRNGGVFLVQYNTNRGLVTAPSPLPLQVSRQRVTDEKAPVRMLDVDHPALQVPNPISPADFDGWVQERGLYFPDQWDPAFSPLLAAADPGSPESEGLLLVAPFGKGYYVYTGLAFFRQLPAGVPGAYRLLANLLALGQNHRP
ncbi:MAG: PIG-L family deacetylase [Saprospiraceae bacterium]|nr:PIG-L family deacetylase [Saprospiraceae bacterium]